jgi:hypothetical protein
MDGRIDEVKEWVLGISGLKLMGEIRRIIGEKYALVPLCPPQIQRGPLVLNAGIRNEMSSTHNLRRLIF